VEGKLTLGILLQQDQYPSYAIAAWSIVIEDNPIQESRNMMFGGGPTPIERPQIENVWRLFRIINSWLIQRIWFCLNRPIFLKCGTTVATAITYTAEEEM
jgi:hypothetical protein